MKKVFTEFEIDEVKDKVYLAYHSGGDPYGDDEHVLEAQVFPVKEIREFSDGETRKWEVEFDEEKGIPLIVWCDVYRERCQYGTWKRSYYFGVIPEGIKPPLVLRKILSGRWSLGVVVPEYSPLPLRIYGIRYIWRLLLPKEE